MIFQGKSIFNASFDIYADNYHTVRPGYPEEMFKDIKKQCEIDKNSCLMEIGAGSGIATAELAKFGCQIIALEPGANLAEIARKQTGKFSNVKIFGEMFENFQTEKKFDAVMAFTSFHWISGVKKYQKVIEVLKDSGSLVLVWNSFFQSDSPVTDEINRAYREFLPDVYSGESKVADVNQGVLSKLSLREREICQNSLFHTIFLRKYFTTYNYDEQTYPKFLNTFPKIVEIEDARRKKFLSRVSEIIKQHSKISVPVLTTLIVCKKKDYFLKMMSSSKGR